MNPVPEEARPPDPVDTETEKTENIKPKKRPLGLRFLIQLVRLILALAFVSFAVQVTGIQI